MSKESPGIGLVQVVWILAGFLVAVAAGFHVCHSIRGSSIRFSTPYLAALSTNGSVYFGHLQDYGVVHLSAQSRLQDSRLGGRRVPIPHLCPVQHPSLDLEVSCVDKRVARHSEV
jgi:hypothetical protein